MFTFFLRRCIAYLIDSVLVFVFVRPELLARAFTGELSSTFYFALEVVAVLLTGMYVVGSHALWGCTVGKAIVGLRVATAEEVSPPPLYNAFLRWIPLLVVGNLPLVAAFIAPPTWSQDLFAEGRWRINLWRLLALAWVLADIAGALSTRGRRSLHDLIGETVVTNAVQT
jgi:RDD family